MNINMAVQGGNKQINVHHILEKFQTKTELYNFLTQDCKIYLPKLRATNVYFYKQLLKGEKKVYSIILILLKQINRDQVKISQIPHYDGLTVQDLLEFARSKDNIKSYLPDEKDWVHLDRQWLGDVLYTLDAKAIQDKIDKSMTARKHKIEESRHELVEMQPEFAQALEKSIQFSSKYISTTNIYRFKRQISILAKE